MKRSVPALIITAVGLGALASFKSTTGVGGSALAGGAHPTPTSPPTSPPAAGGSTPATQPTTPATQVKTGASRTVNGDPEYNRFGTVQVAVTMRSGQIVGVQALQMPYDHQQSAYISQQAEPYLRQEALQAQSAQIDIVGGATYTSESYMQSLQSALDRLRA